MPGKSLRVAFANPDSNRNGDANYYTDAETYTYTEGSTNTSDASDSAASALRPVVNGRFLRGLAITRESPKCVRA